MLPGTPFHSRTAPLCAAHNWRRWGPCVVAGSYDLHPEREYFAVRTSAALFDVSPLYKYAIRGVDATRLLNRVITRDVSGCRVGQVFYTPWCDAAGKVLDDGTLQRLGESVFRLTCAEPNLQWLYANATGLQVDIEDVSEQVAALSLQGPSARAILQHLCPADLNDLRYFHVMGSQLGSVAVEISRTGYSGDLGYEVWCEAAAAPQLWDLIWEAGMPYGLVPAGILALDVARVEAGLLLLDVDYTSARAAAIEARKSSPYELGLGWAVDLRKENFVGRAALALEQTRPAQWRFVGIEVDWLDVEGLFNAAGLAPQVPTQTLRASVPLYLSDEWVGYASSTVWSPITKRYIGLAHLRAPHFATGTSLQMEVTVEHQRRLASAKVVELPFYDPPRKRS